MKDRFYSQVAISDFADLCWLQLHEVITTKVKTRRPRLYLFLSEESKGSLSKRAPEEQDFVLHQQVYHGAATLKDPPLAYVSNWQQVAEECAHLFAIVCKPERRDVVRTIEQEVNHVILHEAFGRFFHCLQMGLPQKLQSQSRKARVSKPQDIWQIGHHEGYALGERLAQKFFDSSLKKKSLNAWFWKKWPSKQALRQLYRLVGTPPKSRVILDILSQ